MKGIDLPIFLPFTESKPIDLDSSLFGIASKEHLGPNDRYFWVYNGKASILKKVLHKAWPIPQYFLILGVTNALPVLDPGQASVYVAAMPIYEFKCNACENTQESFQKLTDPAPDLCESCGASGKMTKAVSQTSFQLKGGGWYSDLYSSPKKETGTTTTAISSTDSGSSKSKSSDKKTTD